MEIQKRPSGRPGAGAIAQLGERLLCKQEVTGSIPVSSTRTKFFDNLKDVVEAIQ